MVQRRLLLVFFATGALLFFSAGSKSSKSDPKWAMNASIIEACSCPMFCQCYFDTKPAAHVTHDGGGEHGNTAHFCRFNNAFKVNKGHHGATRLDGAKFWVAGDLGGDFSKLQMDWAALTFDPSVSKEQRDGIIEVLGKLYPVKWNSFTVADDQKMEWSASKSAAVATLDGGKAAEVRLRGMDGMTGEPVVIQNLRYFGAPRHTGFVLMPNSVEAYRVGDKQFEFKGTNGFMITFDINSNDAK